MSDSPDDHLEAKGERDRERRIEAIKRWVAYIESEPPETWGPQQNAVVNGQLDAAGAVEQSASHRQRVRDVAAEIIGARGDAEETFESRGNAEET